jgi:amino acid transporter
MAAVVAIVPLGIYLGDGAGFTGAIIIAGLVLLCFAAGYVAMSRHIVNAGAFYAYITKGLGKPAGVAAAFLAVLAYNAAFWSLAGGIGYFAQTIFAGIGLNLPWQVWVAIAFAIVALLGRRNVDLSAKVLGVALVLELSVIVVLAVAIVAHNGLSAFPVWQSINPAAVGSGSVGIGLMFAFNMFIGFEATAIFGEETKDPKRTVPRATYLAVGIIAIFFALASLIFIGGVGANEVVASMHNNPGTWVFNLATRYVGKPLSLIMQVLVLTSLFASLLGIHNAAARYFFSLGREGLLPKRLGQLHPKWNSPAAASAFQIIVAVIVVGAFGVANADPLLTVDTSAAGIGTVGILILQAVVAVAVIRFFVKRGGPNRVWATKIAPALGGVGLASVVVLTLVNYPVLSGSPSVLINELPWVFPIVIVAGIGYALWLRRNRPSVYAQIGNGRPEADSEIPSAKVPGTESTIG